MGADKIETSPKVPLSEKKNLIARLYIELPLAYKILFASLTLLSFWWLAVGLYQSHYLSGLRMLGDQSTQNIFGVPKEGRGDETATYIPILKQAYLEGFPEQSTLAPYYESFKLFFGIPVRNWTMVFTPALASYFVLPGPIALSFQGLFYNLVSFLSILWLLTNLGVRRGVAIPAAMMVHFSMYYQVWWTSNFATLGASILPIAILTSSIRWRYKFFLLTWSITHMLMGAMYPPFYYTVAFSLVPLALFIKPDLRKPVAILLAALSAAIAITIYWYYYSEYVEAVSRTVYPGQRFSTGGGAPWSVLLGLLFPLAPAKTTTDVGLTLYELNVIGTFLPVLALATLPIVEFTKKYIGLLIIFGILFLIMSLFIIVGNFPVLLTKYSGLFLVPGRRMQLGISLLTVFVAALIITNGYGKLKDVTVVSILFVFGVVSSLIGIRADAIGQFAFLQYYSWIPFFLGFLGLLWNMLANKESIFTSKGTALSVALWGGAVANLLVFGSFNPVMRSADILKPAQTQFTEDWKALYHAAGMKPIATVANLGHLIRGENFPALDAIHMANVDPSNYSQTFPEMLPKDYDILFNQMRGIRFDNVSSYNPLGLTATLPVMHHAYKTQHEMRRSNVSALNDDLPVNGPISVSEVRIRGLNQFEVYWKTDLQEQIPLASSLNGDIPCSAKSSEITRYPIDYINYTGRVMLRGVAGITIVYAASEAAARACVSSLHLSSPGIGKPTSTAKFEPISKDVLVAAEWSGRACDLTGTDMQITAPKTLLFDGYLIAHSNKIVPEFWVVLRSESSENYRSLLRSGKLRQDVADYFREPQLANSGFRALVKVDKVNAGSYDVIFLFWENGKQYFCESGKKLDVKYEWN